MTFSKKDLTKRLKEGEGLFQEFKTSLERVDRTMVAFANGQGGVIYLGVDDQGKRKGFSLSNRKSAQIEDIAKHIDPSLKIHIENLGKIAAIIVKEGEDKPYRCSSGFYLRVGASNQKLSRNDILNLAVRLNRIQFESLQDLKFCYPGNFSKEALQKFIRDSQLETTLESMGPELFLNSLGVAEKQRGRLIFNHAGILFFGKNPQAFLSQAKLSYARYQGTDKVKIVDRNLLSGTLPEQLQGILQKLKFDIPIEYRLTGVGPREEIPHYPLRAIEEAIVNAMIHRDYSEVGAEIMVDYYSDRIEISNPGELLPPLNLEKLGKRSVRRNPRLAELFFRMGRGERLGSGIKRMKALIEDYQLKAPEFVSEQGFFSVTFFAPKSPLPESKLQNLARRPRQFLAARHQVPEPFHVQDYATRFAITLRTAQKDLEHLIAQNLVIREGKGKTTQYRFAN